MTEAFHLSVLPLKYSTGALGLSWATVPKRIKMMASHFEVCSSSK
jgi:hypothetical protein